VSRLARVRARLVPKTLQSGGLARSAAQIAGHILRDYGWLRSKRENRCVDRDGRAIPWFTYPAIDFLSQFDYGARRVFEFGSGGSTLFWAARSRHVIAVESDPSWCEYVRANAPANCEIILSSDDVQEYAGQICGRQPFDVIVVDGVGEARPMCCRKALEHVKPGGMIILDNSDLWLKSASILRDAGLIQVDFTGFAPLTAHAHTTSAFLTRDFNFQPLDGRQPHKSVAQPVEPWADEGP
jgi:methyltransferase family protein